MEFPNFPEYVEHPDYHSVLSVQLCELIDAKFVDWAADDWAWDGYSEEQRERVCKMFNERFYWREISIVPPGEWKQQLLYRLNYELMPKYKLLYKAVENGIDILQDSDEYGKSRDIRSDFPETLLSGNSDYVSGGNDREFETIRQGSVLDKIAQFRDFRAVDTMLLDELESFFTCIYSTNVNGL